MKDRSELERAIQLLKDWDDLLKGAHQYHDALRDAEKKRLRTTTQISICITRGGYCTQYAVIPLADCTVQSLIRNRKDVLKAELAALGYTV